ncbi:MAG TPA: hypothetical protein VFR67_05935 [Pilimelia sp.]|nr:hypothetical protein [Pilimelia sp.]
MARIHGRRGRIYLGIADESATATPLPFIATWSMSFATDKQDVTAMEDSNKVYVAGLPDASGEFSGFFDDASAQTYTAATDGLPRKFYLYPDRNTATTYFWGTILPDMSINGGVDGAVQISASWNAASSITKVTA